MKAFRDQAGAHGDRLGKYLAGKQGIHQHTNKVLTALQAFLSLSLCLNNREDDEQPELASDIEEVLLEMELSVPISFNRKWLKKMHLLRRGNYTKVFR